MQDHLRYWKHLSIHALLWCHSVFLATVVWDFFLTVILADPTRTLVFIGLTPVISTTIVSLWLVGIFASMFTLIFLLNYLEEKRYIFVVYLSYITIIIAYTLLSIIAFINPLLCWPVLMNYGVNILAGCCLIYFRHLVSVGLCSEHTSTTPAPDQSSGRRRHES